MIHWELWKRLKFGQADKYYMYKPEFVQENMTQDSLWYK